MPRYRQGCRLSRPGDLRPWRHQDPHQVQGKHLLRQEGRGRPLQPGDAGLHARLLLPHLRRHGQDRGHGELRWQRGADGHAGRQHHLHLRAHRRHPHREGHALRHARGLVHFHSTVAVFQGVSCLVARKALAARHGSPDFFRSYNYPGHFMLSVLGVLLSDMQE